MATSKENLEAEADEDRAPEDGTPANQEADPKLEAAKEDTQVADAKRPNINELGRVDREGRLIGAAFPYEVGAGEGVTPETRVEKAEERELVQVEVASDDEPANTRTRRSPGDKR